MAKKSSRPNPRKTGSNTGTSKAGVTRRTKDGKYRYLKNGGKLK